MNTWVHYFENNSCLIKIECVQWQIALLFSVLICSKNCKFATFVFWSFQPKLQYLRYSKSVIFENNYALPVDIGQMYPKVFWNSKFKFSRKCRNKSVCVRTFLRCIYIEGWYDGWMLKNAGRVHGQWGPSCDTSNAASIIDIVIDCYWLPDLLQITRLASALRLTADYQTSFGLPDLPHIIKLAINYQTCHKILDLLQITRPSTDYQTGYR